MDDCLEEGTSSQKKGSRESPKGSENEQIGDSGDWVEFRL